MIDGSTYSLQKWSELEASESIDTFLFSVMELHKFHSVSVLIPIKIMSQYVQNYAVFFLLFMQCVCFHPLSA